MHTTVIIPARYNSTRFPGKLLAPIRGKPVIQYVFENASRAQEVDRVIVATDHSSIFDAVKTFGAEAVMTSPELPSGSDRVAEVAKGLESDIILNVQGDEPLLAPDMIDSTITLLKNSAGDIGTLAKKIDTVNDILDPNVVKVVFDKRGNALYFSRSPIPFYRDHETVSAITETTAQIAFSKKAGTSSMHRNLHFYKHIGIYCYRRDVLLHLTQLPQSDLEKAEKLEQLRALEEGYAIKVGLTEKDTIGIDTPGDLERVEKWLNTYS